MTTYYADFDLASGSETGADAANAWRNHQDSIDGKNLGVPPLSAGDIVLSKGTDTISTRIDQDQGSGDFTSGSIIFRGVNSSWVNDGTRAEINGNNNAIDLLLFNGIDHIRYENFVFKNTSAASGMDGVRGTNYVSSYGTDFINCVFDDCHDLINTGNSGLRNPFFYQCQFLNAAGYAAYMGLSDANINIFVGCIFDTITLDAMYSDGAPIVCVDCYYIDVTDRVMNIGGGTFSGLMQNCTIDNAGDGIENLCTVKAVGVRITNSTVGIDSNAIVTLLNSYMPDTGEDRANTTKTTGIVEEVYINGSNSNNLSGTDTDGGYADPTAGDFNLDESKASQYNQETDLES